MTYKRGPEHCPVYKIGSGLVMASLVLTSCRAEVQPTITETPFSTQPRPTEVLPTAPAYPEGIAPGVVQEEGEIRAAFGVAVGAGGLGDIVPIFNDETLQQSLNAMGLAPILGPEIGTRRVITQIGHQNGGRRACFPNMPAELFNPNVASGIDDFVAANNLIVSYGDKLSGDVRFLGLGAITLEQTPQDVICVNAVINTPDNPFDSPLGKVLNVVMDTQGNIYGTLPAIYSADQQVRIDPNSGEVFVGNDKVWYIGDKMAELAETTIEKTEVVQNGLTYERRESGQLVDLFPGSEVFMTDRGDVVVINEETGLRLAGQVVETEYGTLILLISDRRYQHFYKDNFGETTALGG